MKPLFLQKTSMEVSENSKNELEKIENKIAGIILNGSEATDNKYYYYGGYYRDE